MLLGAAKTWEIWIWVEPQSPDNAFKVKKSKWAIVKIYHIFFFIKRLNKFWLFGRLQFQSPKTPAEKLFTSEKQLHQIGHGQIRRDFDTSGPFRHSDIRVRCCWRPSFKTERDKTGILHQAGWFESFSKDLSKFEPTIYLWNTYRIAFKRFRITWRNFWKSGGDSSSPHCKRGTAQSLRQK